MIVINDNFAPNGFLDSINSGDCVIRAISYVFNMPYEEVCQKFNIKYNDFLECADPNSINENPISFLKIKNAGFNFRKHEQFKGNFFSILPFVKSKTVKYFVDVWLEKHPEIKHNSFVVYVFDPKKDFQEGHAVAIVDGVVHDNRKNNSKRQKDELEKWPILGFSMV